MNNSFVKNMAAYNYNILGHDSHTLDTETLKNVYESIKKSLPGVEETELLKSVFKNIVLEPFANENICYDYDFTLRKKYALRCLILLSHNLTDNDNFCYVYYSLLLNILNSNSNSENQRGYRILNGYMNISSNITDKLLLLQTLTTSLTEGNINMSVFEQFPPNEWRKELLTLALISSYNFKIEQIDNVVSKINKLKDLNYDENLHVVEKVLDVLVNNRSEFDLDINFIHDICFAITYNQQLLSMLVNDFEQLQNEINCIKMNVIKRYCGQLSDVLLEKDMLDLKYFLKYPIEVIEILFSTNENKTLDRILELKQLLEISGLNFQRQIDMLLSLNPSETSINLKYEITFALAKNIIDGFFPSYDKYFCLVNTSDKALKVQNVHLISLSDVKCSCFNINNKCSLHYTTECCDLLIVLNITLARIISNCKKPSELLVDMLSSLIGRINHATRITELINAFDLMYEYNIDFTNQEVTHFLTELTAENYEGAIHEYIIKHSFPGTYIKFVKQLVTEIEETNQVDTSNIMEMFHKVQDSYEKSSDLIPTGVDFGDIKCWSKTKISLWAKYLRINKYFVATDEEILAVIKRAAEVTVKLKLRDVQLLSTLLILKSDNGNGRLTQINTGEGKTLVIAVLTAYSVFKGHKVDVFTSSPLLAIPQSEYYKEFYQVLGISATHNINPHSDYECDVLYGTNNSFQRDVLLDEFRKTGIRKGRKYDVALVDEVDNMLIDGNNWILKISCDMPAMDYLEVLLAVIYIQVNASASSLIEKNGETFYLSEENAIDEKGNIKPEIVVQEIPIEGSKRDFITKCTENHLRKLMRDLSSCSKIEEGYPEIKVPIHLKDIICKVQLEKWISSAISAIFNFTKDEDYILKDGKITIVDAENTGVVKKNSHWSAGLHQFLEIKHGAKIQQENFTTNFISNVGLFTRFTKLYGLTGTLGSEDTRSFLHNTYNVDSAIIPPFKLNQHTALKSIIVGTNEAKYAEIAKSCILKLRNGRAVLIIMKYIKETDELAEVFSKDYKYDTSKIKLLKTDDDFEIVEKPLQPGDLIITTNIAGRGTDIRLSKKVEKNGGLHVCLSFLPLNSRVEHQNIGRTSRKGNKGTSQLVLCDPKESGVEMLKLIRDIQEKQNMMRASETVKKIKIKDRVFHEFCELLEKIKGREQEGPEIKQSVLKSVEERFAFWLILNEDKIDECCDNIQMIFNDFKNEIMKDDEKNELIKNPFMFVEIGNIFLKKKNYQQAIQEYTSAIHLDNLFAEHAYYNRAWAYLSEYGHDMKNNKHFIDQATLDLKKARKLITDREYSLHLLNNASKGAVFSEQVSHKLNLYSIQKNTIELAIGPDIENINEQLDILRKNQNSDNLPSDDKSKLNELIKNLEENKKDVGILGRVRLNERNITIESLGTDFMPKSDQESHIDEILEFERNGSIGGFKISEIKPIDWTSVIGLLCMGIGQLFIGAALTVFTLGAGASIGMGLISEGVSDIITAVKDGIINRDFDWATWALMKVISIAVSVVCAGMKAIKDAARTAYTGSKNILSQGARAFTQLRKDGWKIVAKKIGVDLAKGVAKEIVTDLVTYGFDKAFLPMIEEFIIEKIRIPIQEALMKNRKVAIMLKLDEQNQNNNYQNQIKILARNLLTPEKNSMIKTISLQIATRVADNKGFAITRQVCTGLIGVCELSTFTTDFISKLNTELNKINIDSNNSTAPPENLQNQIEDDNDFDFAQETGAKDENNDIELNKLRTVEEQVIIKKKIHTTDKLSDELAGMVSNNMLHILKGKIIKPITQMGISYSVDKMTQKLTSVDKTIENYRSLKNIVHYQNKISTRKNRIDNLTSSETAKVEEVIERISNGEPAGLIHLGAVSNAVKRPIAVYDEKGRHKYTIGESINSTPIQVQYHSPRDGSDIGHFTLKGCREPHREGTSSNMCLFNTVAEQTGHDPNDLKNLTLNIMKNNKTDMSKQIIHIRRLEMYDQSGLLKGGAQYNGKNPDHAKNFLRNSLGVVGFGNIVVGHADKHIPFKGKTIDKLNAIVDETGRHIEVYDKKGTLAYIIGEKKDSVEPIKLQYHKPQNDTYAEYFSSIGGDEKYYIHDPNDTKFYDIISNQTGTNAGTLRTATLSRIDKLNVPPTNTCLENETMKKLKSGYISKTGFLSEDDAALALHHALQTEAAKDAMKQLNEYKDGVNDSEDYKKVAVHITAKELNLPRVAYGGFWKKGTLKVSWPVTDVVVVFQHYENHQTNPNARVHIQTFYPKPP